MKLLLSLVLVVVALADDPITVDPNGSGGLPPQIQGTGLTMAFCKVADSECKGTDISKKSAPATSECLKRCGRSPDCLNAFFDSKKICHLRGNRCDVGARDSSPGAIYLHRLKDGESCPADTPEYFSTIPKYSNRFCLMKGKACEGHNLYKRPQKISKFIKCLRKCVGINECVMVDFYDGNCELKDYACTDDELVDAPGRDNYVRLDMETEFCPGNREVPGETLVPQPKPEPKPEPEKPEPKPEPEPEPTPDCGIVFGNLVNGDDHISTAKCEGDTYAVGCRCIPSKNDGYCDGVTISEDGTECRAHGAHGGGELKAEATCGPVKDFSLVSYLNYKQPSYAECPAGSELVSCYLHSYWSHDFKNDMTPTSSGNTCFANPGCRRCGVQAICSGVAGEVIYGNEVNGDDQISTAECPENTIAVGCQCIPSGNEGYGDGVTLSDDGRECRGHGAYGGGAVKAKATCAAVDGAFVVSKMEYGQASAVTCPGGGEVLECFLHSYWTHEYTHAVQPQVSGNTCYAKRECNKCAVQAICKGGKAVVETVEGNQVDGDDQISTAACSSGNIVIGCECIPNDNRKYCDGVTLSDDGTECRGHAAYGGGAVKAKAYCGKGSQTVVSNLNYRVPSEVSCPIGSTLTGCYLHTYWGHDYKGLHFAKTDGNRCFADPGCHKCGVQVTCDGVTCTNEEGPRNDGDDKISSVTCSSGYAVNCHCIPESNSGYCDGVTLSDDGKTCNAHGAHGGGPFKARACCDSVGGEVSVTSNLRYGFAHSVSCPGDSELVNCYLHTYWAHDFKTALTPIRDGNSCRAQNGCRKCGVQAMCKGASNCSPVSGPVVDGDDKVSSVACPGDTYPVNCRVAPQNDQGYGDGTTLSDDGKTCEAHGAHRGGPIKAEACCAAVSNAHVASNLNYRQPSEVSCPYGSDLVSCNVHSYWSTDYPGAMAPRTDGNKCYADKDCHRCGAEALCSGEACTKVTGAVVNGDDKISTAKCDGDTYAVGCRCIASKNDGYCDGNTISDDGKECRAHAAHGGGEVKAEACCAAVKGKVSVVSNLNYKQASSVTCSCPGSKLIACYLHSYWSHDHKHAQNPKVDGNRCYAEQACNNCGVQAICSK